MPRGRSKGFHHSEETKAKMRGNRKVKEDAEKIVEESEKVDVPTETIEG